MRAGLVHDLKSYSYTAAEEQRFVVMRKVRICASFYAKVNHSQKMTAGFFAMCNCQANREDTGSSLYILGWV